mgnify:CR=1 FL=1
MRILAIDSSGLVATIAILEDDSMLAEYTLNYKKTHSQTLLPMLDEVVKRMDFDMNRCDCGCSRTWIIYRIAYWLSYGKRLRISIG